jgi:allantoicase
MEFTDLIDLASERLGGAVVFANDEFFAPKENLLKTGKPVFVEGKYTDVGKWMDGWETRRRRTPGFDWCIIRLGLAGILHGVVIDTTHFKGNYPEQASLEAYALEGNPDAAALSDSSVAWTEVLPKSALRGDCENPFVIGAGGRATHLRLKIFPDGGVARFKAYGEVAPDWRRIHRQGTDVDLAAVENGGLVLACSDMFFSSRHNLIMPGRSLNMSDGWETRRRRGPGHDWAIIRLGTCGTIRKVEVDTSHFKGNFPESFSLEACRVNSASAHVVPGEFANWSEVIPRTKLQADTRHDFEKEIQSAGEVTHVRFNIFPDGGVSRLRIFGAIARK